MNYIINKQDHFFGEIKKENRFGTLFFLSGREDLNRGPLRPERSALAGLSHAPIDQAFERSNYNLPANPLASAFLKFPV